MLQSNETTSYIPSKNFSAVAPGVQSEWRMCLPTEGLLLLKHLSDVTRSPSVCHRLPLWQRLLLKSELEVQWLLSTEQSSCLPFVLCLCFVINNFKTGKSQVH